MSEAFEILKIFGAMCGFVVLVWKIIEIWGKYNREYLFIDLSVEITHGRFLSAKTIVENKNTVVKMKIENALLLIGPEKENPINTIRNIGRFTDNDEYQNIASTNEIAEIRCFEHKMGENGRCLIPIEFFYSENIAIADEKLSYRCPIPTKDIEKNTPYSVRFFIHERNKYYRSTHDSFVLPLAPTNSSE